jgi:hypothetical protein
VRCFESHDCLDAVQLEQHRSEQAKCLEGLDITRNCDKTCWMRAILRDSSLSHISIPCICRAKTPEHGEKAHLGRMHINSPILLSHHQHLCHSIGWQSQASSASIQVSSPPSNGRTVTMQSFCTGPASPSHHTSRALNRSLPASRFAQPLGRLSTTPPHSPPPSPTRFSLAGPLLPNTGAAI